MLQLVERTSSEDGATRFIWRLSDGRIVDTVLLEHKDKNCICLPTQIGCSLGCVFCVTGQSFLIRNLYSEELSNLAFYTLEEVQKDREIEVNRLLFNREGEPFKNYSNLLGVCNILQSSEEFQDAELLVSTAGLTPYIYALANDNPRIRLWVSLNAPTQDLRSKLMPINRIYGLYQLIDACSHYANISGEKVRMNYILIENLNDSHECAIELARLVSGKPLRLQIAKMNPFAGYRSPHEQKIHHFLSVLEDFGIETEYFKSKGVAIGGGCGQAYRKETSQDIAAEEV